MPSLTLPHILTLLLVLLPRASFAHKTTLSTFTCPIDGTRWQQSVDVSGSQFGTRLDLKPLGPIAAPWTLPQCPKCHFVIDENEAAGQPVAKLKRYILSEPYQSATKGQPTYFCLALIRAFLEAGPQEIGYAYLAASWQTEANPPECRRHLESALRQFATALPGLKPDSPDFQTTSILCCELERRTHCFEQARERCLALLQAEAFKAANLQQVLKRELAFIGQQDSAPHAMTAEREDLLE